MITLSNFNLSLFYLITLIFDYLRDVIGISKIIHNVEPQHVVSNIVIWPISVNSFKRFTLKKITLICLLQIHIHDIQRR